MARLTDAQAADIRSRYQAHREPNMRQLADEYGVSVSTIFNVVQRRWHVGGRIGGKRNAWTVRIMDMLSHGPIPTQTVIAEAMGLVPPGRALREAEAERLRQNLRRGTNHSPEPGFGGSQERSIRAGQRSLVWDAVGALRRAGTIKKVEIDGVECLVQTRSETS